MYIDISRKVVIVLLSYYDGDTPILWGAMHDAKKLDNGRELFNERHALAILATEIVNYTNTSSLDSRTTLSLDGVDQKKGLYNILLDLPLDPSVGGRLYRLINQAFPDDSEAVDKFVCISKKLITVKLDSMLAAYKKIPHISYLFSNEPEIACQMYDLLEFTPVAQQKRISRDFSYLVPKDYQQGAILQDIVKMLGKDAKYLEELKILSVTSFKDLPPAARKRLGATPNHKNVLLHLAIRPSETDTVFDKNYWEMFHAAINFS